MKAMLGPAGLLADPSAAWPITMLMQTRSSHTLHETSAAAAVAVTLPQVPTVLALVIEACPSNQLDSKALCSLLQVSVACRQALQGSRDQHRVSIKASDAAVSGFEDWLPKWAGLVAEVHLQPTKPYIKELSWDTGSKLFMALQQCADPTCASTAAGAAPAAMPLLLTGFSSDVFLSQEVMEGLPFVPPSITRLELGSVSMWAPGLPAALQRLSNLARHKLDRHCPPKLFTHVTALQQLSRLTSLEISPIFSGDTKNLATSLVVLKLCFEAGMRMEPSPSDSEGDDAALDEWSESWESSDKDWPDYPYGHACRTAVGSVPPAHAAVLPAATAGTNGQGACSWVVWLCMFLWLPQCMQSEHIACYCLWPALPGRVAGVLASCGVCPSVLLALHAHSNCHAVKLMWLVCTGQAAPRAEGHTPL